MSFPGSSSKSGHYEFMKDTSYMYGKYNLSSEQSYLRKWSVLGSLTLLAVDIFVFFLPWTIVASIIWGVNALFVWIIMLPFLIRIPLLIWSIIDVKFPHKIGSVFDLSYQSARKYYNIRLLGIPAPYATLRKYGYISDLLHPALILVTLVTQGALLIIYGSVLLFIINLVMGVVIIIGSYFMIRMLLVEFYSKPFNIALERQITKK